MGMIGQRVTEMRMTSVIADTIEKIENNKKVTDMLVDALLNSVKVTVIESK